MPISSAISQKRDDESYKIVINAFNQSLEVYLNPTDGYLVSESTPVWTVRPDRFSQKGLKYRQVENVSLKNRNNKLKS